MLFPHVAKLVPEKSLSQDSHHQQQQLRHKPTSTIILSLTTPNLVATYPPTKSSAMAALLTEQAKELQRLVGLAQRETSRQILQAELARVTEALASATTSDPPPAPRPAPAPAPTPIRLSSAPTTAPIEYSSISNYAWDHSSKFVKVYLTIPGLEKIADAQIEAVFGERSLVLSIAGVSTPPVNRRLNVPTLCHAVRDELCSWVRKPPDMLLVKLRKASDGEEWASLNDSAAQKETQQKEKTEANKARARLESSRGAAPLTPMYRRPAPLAPRAVAGQVDRGAAEADVRRGGRGGQARALQSLGVRTR